MDLENKGETIIDQNDDSEPEDVSFVKSKQEIVENLQKVRDQIAQIRENQKQKRIQRQEKYIEQKKKKLEELENSKLPDDILEEISKSKNKINEKVETSENKSPKRKNKKLKLVTPVKRRFIESNLPNSAVSDFIPLKSYKNYGISVINLSNINKKPLIASDSAKNFKNTAFNRRGINRQTAKERLAVIRKKTALNKK